MGTYHLGRKLEHPERVAMQVTHALPKAAQFKTCDDADPNSSRPVAKGLICDICGKSYSCAQGLRTHVRQVHELKKYGENSSGLSNCAECGQSFRNAEALMQHVAAVHRGSLA